ncbi:MAG: haloacid dehalogenase type II [bacterium]|nr:haloacid dehalogenase type II [bacterium]
MAIRIVAFDLYGTLLDIGALVNVLRAHTPMPEAALDAWRQRQLQLANAAASSARYMDFDRVTLLALTEIAPRFHMKLQPEDVKKLIDAWAHLPAFPDALAGLDAASRRWFNPVVLTNAVASTARNALAFAGLGAQVNHVFSADAVKSYKPKQQVYMQLTSLGVEPAEVLFVSANDWDATGARQVGFHTVWVTRRRSGLAVKPERKIDDLTELDALLHEYELAVP